MRLQRKAIAALTILSMSGQVLTSAQTIELNSGSYGVDVSEHNRNVDFATLESQGNEFAIIRLGYGGVRGDSQRDKLLDQHVQRARESNTPILAFYQYSYAKTIDEAKDEADQAIRHLTQISAEKGSYVVYDIEQYSNAVTTDELSEIVTTFFDKIEAAGYKPMLYSGYNFYYANLNTESLRKYDKWIAHYGATQPTNSESQLLAIDPTLKSKISSIPNTRIWQFSSTSSYSGYTGVLDKNVLLTDLAFKDNLPMLSEPDIPEVNQMTVNHVDENSNLIKTETVADFDEASTSSLDSSQYFWLNTSRSGDVVTKTWKKKTWAINVKNASDGSTIDTIVANSQEEFDDFDLRRYESDTLAYQSYTQSMQSGTYKKEIVYSNKSQQTEDVHKYIVRNVDLDGNEISSTEVDSLDSANSLMLDESVYMYRGSSTSESADQTIVTKKWSLKSWTIKIVLEDGSNVVEPMSVTKDVYDSYELDSKDLQQLSSNSSMKNGVYEKTFVVKRIDGSSEVETSSSSSKDESDSSTDQSTDVTSTISSTKDSPSTKTSSSNDQVTESSTVQSAETSSSDGQVTESSTDQSTIETSSSTQAPSDVDVTEPSTDQSVSKTDTSSKIEDSSAVDSGSSESSSSSATETSIASSTQLSSSSSNAVSSTSASSTVSRPTSSDSAQAIYSNSPVTDTSSRSEAKKYASTGEKVAVLLPAIGVLVMIVSLIFFRKDRLNAKDS